MKIKIYKLVLILILASTSLSYAQDSLPYYDALYFKKIYSIAQSQSSPTKISLDNSNVLKLLKYYFGNADIASEIKNNPFLKDYFATGGSASLPDAIPFLSSTASSVGGANVTNFADGLAKFIVERFKQELTLAFFNKFKAIMDDQKYGDLKILFPETWKTLYAIDKDIYNYTAYLNTLREAFIKDMTNGFTDLQTLLKQQKYQDLFNRKSPVLGSILNSSLYFINSFASGKHPGDVLAGYDTTMLKLYGAKPGVDSVEIKKLQLNLRNSIATIQLISKSFRSKSKDNYWVSADSVMTLVEDPIAFKIYLGLIYQKVGNIKFSGGVKLKTCLDTVAKHYDAALDSINIYRNFFETLISHAQEVNEGIANLRSKKKADVDFNDYYKLFNASLDLIAMDTSFINLPYLDRLIPKATRIKVKNTSTTFLYVAHCTGDLYVDVRTKNYGSAILEVGSILDTLLDYNKDTATKIFNSDFKVQRMVVRKGLPKMWFMRKHRIIWFAKKYAQNHPQLAPSADSLKWTNIAHDFTTKFSAVQFTASDQKSIIAFINTKLKLDAINNSSKFKNVVFKYGTFIATVAQAQNSDDVKNAIESIALPVGSASIKKHSTFNVSLNSYAGGFAGYEHIKGVDVGQKEISFKNWNSYGVIAPVGIAVSSNFGIKWKNSPSLSIFLSAIDIGALASFRLTNSSTSTVPDVQLKDIVSPGVFVSLGLPCVPVSLNVGYQLGPLLRQVTSQENTYSQNYTRFSVSLCVDIPILNFYTSQGGK